jgi:hypothetical protein
MKDCVSLRKRAAISLFFTKLHRFARNYVFFHLFACATHLPIVFNGISHLYNTSYCLLHAYMNSSPMCKCTTPLPSPTTGNGLGGRLRPAGRAWPGGETANPYLCAPSVSSSSVPGNHFPDEDQYCVNNSGVSHRAARRINTSTSSFDISRIITIGNALAGAAPWRDYYAKYRGSVA